LAPKVRLEGVRTTVLATKTRNHADRVAAIIATIRRIPKGKVQSYGGIDNEAPRLVGRVLATTNERVPWQRVVHADGSIPKGKRQRDLLVKEGVVMKGDRVDMKKSRAW
jgi:methylated-DNA-protein-cysteine methyltransferase-like protein